MKTALQNPKLYIQLLGTFSLSYNQHLVPEVNTPRLQSLLAYILLHRDLPIHRQTIASLFWPETSDAQARTNLRRLLHQLRSAFPEISSYLILDSTTVSWDNSSSYRLDLEEFENAAINATAISELQVAMELYSGDLLPHIYQDWLVTERARLGRLYENVLQRLAERLESEGDYRNAIRVIQQSLQIDPLREETYHQLMRLHAHNGDRASVHRVYQTCERVLASELGVTPGPETTLAYQTGLQPGQRMQQKEILYPTNIILPKTNLASELDSLIGRVEELEQIKSLVTHKRLVTITGFGGIGKTRLALAAGREMYDYFPDGVFWVDLAPVDDPLLVTHTVLSTLKVDEIVMQSQFDNLSSFLKYKHMLLIVDNCEHLLKNVSELIVALLETCPDLYILATCRARLHTSGEAVYPLQPLPIPEISDEASENASIQLFTERAQALLPTFKINEGNREAVINICRHLNGIPLAIELAAGRVPILSSREILTRLELDFRLLRGGSSSLPRHQTLTATLDWSHALLSPKQQILLRRLAVFAGDFTLEDAEAIISGKDLPSEQVLECLADLIDHSLVSSQEIMEEHFYRLHEVIRKYALQKLQEAEELHFFQSLHLEYYSQLATTNEILLKGPGEIQWMKHIDHELGNFRAAIEWGLQQDNLPELNRTLQLISSLYIYWWNRSTIAENFYWVESALRVTQGLAIDPIPLSNVFLAAATYYFLQGQHAKADAVMELSLEKARQSNDLATLAFSLKHVGIAAMNKNEVKSARDLVEEALRIARSLEDRWLICNVLNELGVITKAEGKLDDAYQIHLEQLELARKSGDAHHQASALTNLSDILIQLGKLEEATVFNEEVLSINQILDHPRGIAYGFVDRARLSLRMGRIEEVEQFLKEGLAIYRRIGDWNNFLYAMEMMALEMRNRGKIKQAVRMLSACHAARLQYDMTDSPDRAHQLAAFRNESEHTERMFQQWWDEGQKLSIDEAVQLIGKM
jgi:predicted ATPase/DNA-binding SARP family transcriptional activator/Tfp pilus assembly protein PilF